jgi:hypothetical protein
LAVAVGEKLVFCTWAAVQQLAVRLFRDLISYGNQTVVLDGYD